MFQRRAASPVLRVKLDGAREVRFNPLTGAVSLFEPFPRAAVKLHAIPISRLLDLSGWAAFWF